jgi:hypothetical protein
MTTGVAYWDVETLLADDPGGRGISECLCPGDFFQSLQTLIHARHVGIVTGFFIPQADTCETDGPPGAAALQRALFRLGKRVTVLTDGRCQAVVSAVCHSVATDPNALMDCDVLLAIERVGRAADGAYRNMRNVDITQWTEPFDEMFKTARPRGVGTIGIGDGGNEIGMGKVHARISSRLPGACVVATDTLIATGVSNWGGWALAMALLQSRSFPLPHAPEFFNDLIHCVDAGAVDGITGRREPTVDQLPWNVHEKKIEQMRQHLCHRR